MQVGKLEEWKQGKIRENRREKPRHSKIRTTQFSGANFAPPYPFVRNHFCEHFPKACSRSLPKISVRKCTGMWTLCEIAFMTIFQKSMLSVLENHRNAKISHFTIHLVRNSHLLFKSQFLFLNSKLVFLQSSQHFFSNHFFPSTRSSPSPSPILNPTMAAHLKSFIP